MFIRPSAALLVLKEHGGRFKDTVKLGCESHLGCVWNRGLRLRCWSKEPVAPLLFFFSLCILVVLSRACCNPAVGPSLSAELQAALLFVAPWSLEVLRDCQALEIFARVVEVVVRRKLHGQLCCERSEGWEQTLLQGDWELRDD